MRRINRRMLLQKIVSMEKYVKYLKENTSEVAPLYQDILINVTSFFREPDTFEALKRSVFPHIVNKTESDVPVRIWVPACSTGEEAYSIAMALAEYMDENKNMRPVQLFATDIDDIAIEKARKGIYPENILKDVSPERLGRFFEKIGNSYVINKSVRGMCIFAKQNIVKDPPFSKIDFISCRNMLIYFGPELQKKAIRIFFYALNPKGFLMIGQSETVGEVAGLFTMTEKKNAIYAKKVEQSMQYFEASAVEYGKEKVVSKKAEVQTTGIGDIQKEIDNIILTKYSPAGIVVNEALKILLFRGDTGPYLRPAPGQPSFDLLKMVNEDIVSQLRTVLHQAKEENIPVSKESLRVKQGKLMKYVNVDVVPFKASISGERCFLVLLEETTNPPITLKSGTAAKGGKEDEEMVRLRLELDESKTHLHTMAQEHEAANEELQSMNEELQSSNEEMQSINEEMETAKEELQSTNEELTTVNDELRSRNEESTQLSNDLLNVLKGVEIPVIILGNELQIRRFNDAAARLLNLLPSDSGRPLSNIRTNINVPDLEQMVTEVINNLTLKGVEVKDTEGRWYSITIRPYKTVDNRIDGVLMTLVDIDDLKRAYHYANSIIETVREPLLVLDSNLNVMTANRSFYETFLVKREETEGRYLYELGNHQWDIPDLRKLLQEIVSEKKFFSDYELIHEFPNIGRRTMMLNAREIRKGVEASDGMVLLAIEDVTERKQTKEIMSLNDDLRLNAVELELSYKEMESFSYSISHDLRAPLRIINSFSDILLKDHADKLDDEVKKYLHFIQGNAQRMDQLVMALLELSRIGRQDIKPVGIEMEKAVSLIVADLKASAPERNITADIKKLPPAYGDLTLIRQVLTNVLSNAFKFTKDRDVASIEIGGGSENGENVYYVKDNGAGFDMEHADKLFKVFHRLHPLKEFEGIGIGLSIVQRIIQRHGGRVWADGKPGEGATFYFSLPVRKE